MTKSNIYSHKGFKFGVFSIALFIISIFLLEIMNLFEPGFLPLIIGLLIFTSGIFAVIGPIYSIRGFKEPNTIKKIIGLLFNFGIILLFIFVIIANVFDIYNSLK